MTKQRFDFDSGMAPCAVCGKTLLGKKGSLFVTCRQLGNVHGDECECMLQVGRDCYARLEAKGKIRIMKEAGA
jgi:hypothetical protein